MSNELGLRAEDTTIEKFLFSKESFQIPRYQRPYSWGYDHFTDFWNDIYTAKGDFFIGSFILNYENFKKTGLVEVIDGQQRMLTITIFIAVLRDILNNELKEPGLGGTFQRICIAFEDRLGKQTIRLKCGDSAKEYFEKYIQTPSNDVLSSDTPTDEEVKIKLAYKFFHEKVTNHLKEYQTRADKIKRISKLREAIGDLLVICIQIQNEDNAYEIFETVNARGADLSVADLVKNLVFKNLKVKDESDKDLARELWGDIVSAIQDTGTDLKRFLRYYWLSKYKFIEERKLFKSIKSEITDFEKFLFSLYDDAGLYNKIVDINENDWVDVKNGNKIYKSISALKYIRVTQCQVLLLSILRNLKKLGTDPTHMIQCIEKFSFAYSAVCGLPTNRLERIYSKFALKIEHIVETSHSKKIPGEIQSTFEDLKKELLELFPSFEFFKDSFQNIEYKNSDQSRQLIKYILNEINGLTESGEYLINFDNVNIEHILPQKPENEWGLSQKEIKPYVNKLGNLTLISKIINSTAGNKIIKHKIKDLEQSKLPITQGIVDRLKALDLKWDEDAILKRHDELAGIAYNQVWALK